VNKQAVIKALSHLRGSRIMLDLDGKSIEFDCVGFLELGDKVLLWNGTYWNGAPEGAIITPARIERIEGNTLYLKGGAVCVITVLGGVTKEGIFAYIDEQVVNKAEFEACQPS
jgi:hypothetical protein